MLKVLLSSVHFNYVVTGGREKCWEGNDELVFLQSLTHHRFGLAENLKKNIMIITVQCGYF